jgi:hypothetical protein
MKKENKGNHTNTKPQKALTEKCALTKQCLQPGHCHTQPIKARLWIFTLQGRTLNFSYTVAPIIYTVAKNYES